MLFHLEVTEYNIFPSFNYIVYSKKYFREYLYLYTHTHNHRKRTVEADKLGNNPFVPSPVPCVLYLLLHSSKQSCEGSVVIIPADNEVLHFQLPRFIFWLPSLFSFSLPPSLSERDLIYCYFVYLGRFYIYISIFYQSFCFMHFN